MEMFISSDKDNASSVT